MPDTEITQAGIEPLPSGWPAMTIAAAHAKLTAVGSRCEMAEYTSGGIKGWVWKNGPSTLREILLIARSHQDRTFLVYEDDRVSYSAFARAVVMLAHELQARGVRKGDRVAVAMRNVPEWPVAMFAGALCGAIATPLNAWWTGEELAFGLADSGAKVAIVDAERYQRIAGQLAACPELEQLYVCRAKPTSVDQRVTALEDVVGAINDWGALPDRALPDVELAAEDDATLFYTSGTTGKPKGALATHRSVTTNVMTAAAAKARAYLRRGQLPPDAATLPPPVLLVAIPLFHVIAFNASLLPTMVAGGKLVFLSKWDTEKALQLIEREGVTVTGGVPTIAWQLAEHPDFSKYDLSTLESVAYGGAPSSSELVRRLREVLPKSMPGTGWGMTETAGTFTTNSAEDYINRPGSCGPAPAVGAIKIMPPGVTPEAAPALPAGEIGELWVTGPMVVKGYWNDLAATRRTFVAGWLYTGDIARVDEEGFCYIVDRAKDMLIRGGENIYCIEVENVLYEHSAVMDAALVGIAHKTLGEEPAAVVQLRPYSSATEDEIRAWVASRLAAFKVPVKVIFQSQPLPRNAAGKVLKHELKKLFGDTA